jgi:hypothetical protein
VAGSPVHIAAAGDDDRLTASWRISVLIRIEFSTPKADGFLAGGG